MIVSISRGFANGQEMYLFIGWTHLPQSASRFLCIVLEFVKVYEEATEQDCEYGQGSSNCYADNGHPIHL